MSKSGPPDGIQPPRRIARLGGAAWKRRPSGTRVVSPVLFGAILIAFALPFATVSCNGPPVRFTGYELATWNVPQTTPSATTDEGESLPTAIESDASFFALLALAAAVVGLTLGLARRRGGGFASVLGLTGVVGMFGASFHVLGGPEVTYEAGFTGTALLFTAAAVWHAALAVWRRLHRDGGSPVVDVSAT